MLSLVEKGHTDLFNSVTLSPDEKAKKVSGSDNKAIQVTNSPATLNVLSEKTGKIFLYYDHKTSHQWNKQQKIDWQILTILQIPTMMNYGTTRRLPKTVGFVIQTGIVCSGCRRIIGKKSYSLTLT